MRDELIRDSRDVDAGFLKDNSMKSPAGRRKGMCGILACWAEIPLKNREAVLVMHEVAELTRVPCQLGLGARRDIGSTVCVGFGKCSCPARSALLKEGCFPAREAQATLHLRAAGR